MSEIREKAKDFIDTYRQEIIIGLVKGVLTGIVGGSIARAIINFKR